MNVSNNNWISLVDMKTGKSYWANTVTKQTQWEMPDELKPPPPPPESTLTSASQPPPPPSSSSKNNPIKGNPNRGVLPSTFLHVRNKTNNNAAADFAASILSGGASSRKIKHKQPVSHENVKSELEIKMEEMRRKIHGLEVELSTANDELSTRREVSRSITSSNGNNEDKLNNDEMKKQLLKLTDLLAEEKQNNCKLKQDMYELQQKNDELSKNVVKLNQQISNYKREISKLRSDLSHSQDEASNELELAMKLRKLRQKNGPFNVQKPASEKVNNGNTNSSKDKNIIELDKLNPLQKIKLLQQTGDKKQLKKVLQEHLKASSDDSYTIPAKTPKFSNNKDGNHRRAISQLPLDVSNAILKAPPVANLNEVEEVVVEECPSIIKPIIKTSHNRSQTSIDSIDIDLNTKNDNFNDWQTLHDNKTGKVYYYNKVTKETSWTIEKHTNLERIEESQEILTESDWQEFIDNKTGKIYYYNRKTKCTQWDKPI